MKYLILIATFCCILFFSCKSENEVSLEEAAQIVSDTSFIDIPAQYQAQNLLKEEELLLKSIGIPDLKQGFPGTQIRIWVGSNDTNYKLIVFTNKDQKWTGSYYTFNYKLNTDSSLFDKFEKKVKYLSPKTGWDFFTNQLMKLDILTLPDYTLIEEYDVPMDSISILIEIAGMKRYRLYSYPSPFLNNEIKEAQKVNKIISLIEKEFQIILDL